MDKSQHSILIADDDEDVLSALTLVLKKQGYRVVTVNNKADAIRSIERKQFSCVLIDLNYSQDTTSGQEGKQLLEQIRALDSKVPVIALTGYGSIDLAVEIMRLGANDFIEKPWRNSQLIKRVEQQVEHVATVRQSDALKQENQILKSTSHLELIAQSQMMQDLLQKIQRIAVSDMNVLFTGENGTGKSMLANYLHQQSLRQPHTFLAVNMGGITESLFESEMFGHVKGAFTDAKEDRIGRFEIAQNGTLFLDEIANIHITQQAKLLRVLEERQFERVGSSQTLQTNVRLLSATNSDLNQMIGEGTFRQDLLYRLNTVEIRVPSLKERVEDIVPLAEFFLTQFCSKYAMTMKQFDNDAISAMLSYSWPGNIRELSHTIERALFLSQTDTITLSSLALNNVTEPANIFAGEPTLEHIEKQTIIERLNKYDHHPQKTADSLGLKRSSYYRRLEKYNLN